MNARNFSVIISDRELLRFNDNSWMLLYKNYLNVKNHALSININMILRFKIQINYPRNEFWTFFVETITKWRPTMTDE